MAERSITGRDGYIMAQALATAIHYLGKAPDLHRPDSNIAEMRRLTFWETGLLGASAGLLALPTGYILAWILIFVINQRSFGWTLQMHADPGPFVQAFLWAVGAALLATIYPAWRIGSMQTAAALRGE